MGIQSVFEKCIILRSDDEIAQITPGLISNIEKHKKRFEKAAYTFWNESENMAIWNMLAKENETPTQAKRAYFEKHKEEIAHRYLAVLCDLFDYKCETEND